MTTVRTKSWKADKLGIILDFDGTIATPHPGFWLIERYLGEAWKEIKRKYKSGEINRHQMQQECTRLLPPDRDKLLSETLEHCSLVPGFAELATWCKAHDIEMCVCTDGFGFHAEKMLERSGLGYIPVACNKIEWADPPQISLPYANPICKSCGVCKRMIMESMRDRVDRIIFIGDGANDRFVAQHADFVLAKEELLQHCSQAGICYAEWQDFFDVKKTLEGYI
jgi:2-hydroxy-3-keto-5-methylthiopentenyl-1-phosphate phosphatase